MPESTAEVMTSVVATCAALEQATRCPPVRTCSASAIWFAIVPVGHVQGGGLAESLGGELLQPVHGRIVAVPGVAHLGLGHGRAHRGRRRW